MALHNQGVLHLLLFLLVLLSSETKQSESAGVFAIVNGCKETIWPGIFPGEIYEGGGFALKPGQSVVFNAPTGGWVGRIWARTGCKFDQAGKGTCQTGNCGTSLKCADPGAPPASLAEFNIAARDFYDVSLVDGFNLPVTIFPLNGSGNCSVAGCDGDVRDKCPSELAVKADGKTVACQSACNVFDSDEYCCRGTYNSPANCQASNYTMAFKQACPSAYSYAYDDPTSLFTCSGADYVVAFCSDRKKSVCTYHDKKLTCSGSGSGSASGVGELKAMTLRSLIMTAITSFFIMWLL